MVSWCRYRIRARASERRGGNEENGVAKGREGKGSRTSGRNFAAAVADDDDDDYDGGGEEDDG